MEIYTKCNITEPLIREIVESFNKVMHDNTDILLYYKLISYYSVEKDTHIEIDIVVVSAQFGVIIFKVADCTDNTQNTLTIKAYDELVESINQIYSKLLKNKTLRQGINKLSIPITGVLVTNCLKDDNLEEIEGIKILYHTKDISVFLNSLTEKSIDKNQFQELLSVIDSSKVLHKTKNRSNGSKSVLAEEIENNIAIFCQEQRNAIYIPIEGFEILRGLAGSGKTVLLAYKAALLHRQYPHATIAFTFYTKSLYQNVQNLIRRFYKSLTDIDTPNWEKIRVLHAWGGQNSTGIYYEACKKHDIETIPFAKARAQSTIKSPFDIACSDFLGKCSRITSIYDYILIDEGQDFPASFVKMCNSLAVNNKVVWAYDDLQTIFQENNPSSIAAEIGVRVENSNTLKICYRNPNEILLCAHAIGFGLYGDIVQIFDKSEEWEYLGYEIKGELKAGNTVELVRPPQNIRMLWETSPSIQEIISLEVCNDFAKEINYVVSSIKKDISEGLRPDDILVIAIDDQYAKSYLSEIEDELIKCDIKTNNIHKDIFGEYDFMSREAVTLSTVHKAKGNEAFMVYVVGVDSTFKEERSSIRLRNMLYTAMTRAKGWLRLSGIGEKASRVKYELDCACKYYPSIKFTYPDTAKLSLIKNNIKIANVPTKAIDDLLALKDQLGDEAFKQLIADMVKGERK